MRNQKHHFGSRLMAAMLTLCLLLQACPPALAYAAQADGWEDATLSEESFGEWEDLSADAGYYEEDYFADYYEETVSPLNVTNIIQAYSAADIPAEIPADTRVELMADITPADGWQITGIAGILDGMGHTITVKGLPLAKEVTGTVQNLFVSSAVPVKQGGFDPFGVIAVKLTGGMILNCGSDANIEAGMGEPGGLVGESLNGTVRNSYYAGELTGFGGGGVIGKSTDTAAVSVVTDCYYTKGTKPVSWGNAYNEDGVFGNKTAAEMKAPEFAELMNANITDTGFIWAVSEGALPVLAASGMTPEPPAPDYTGLNAVINEAKLLLQHEAEYTEESFSAMRAALIEAEGIRMQETYPTQDEINAAAAALRNAIDGLKKPAADPMTGLKALVAECEQLKAEDYTPETWGPFEAMLGDARAAIERNEQDAEIIGFTCQDLKDAKGRLQKAQKPDPADPLAELKALVAEAEKLKQEDYTPETWGPFTGNLMDARACIARNETDPEMIGYAVDDLKNGMAALQKAEPKDPNAVDVTKLQEAIDSAKAIRNDGAVYTVESWNRLQTALGSAEALLNQEGLTQEKVNQAESDLRAAIAGLKRNPADKSRLQAAIAEAKALNEKEYTDGSWGNMFVAIMMAESAMKDPNVTQETIDGHEKAVREAMASLKKKIVVTELQAAIDEAKALNEKDFTPESWAAMQEKLTAAEDEVIYQHSQEKVDAAAAALRQAVKDLKKPGQGVDTSKLAAVIAEAKALKEQDYTDSSWANLQIALMMAEPVLKNPDATQEQVDAKTAEVRAAIDSLKAKIVVTGLQAAIDEAKALNEKDYTPESWAAMQEKLTAAEDEVIYQHSQEKVDAAAAALRQAVKDLKKPGGTDPQPDDNAVKVGSGEEMPDVIEAGTTVVLTADITLNKQITVIAGVLDGHGHTVTVAGQALAQEVTGTVQNLGVLSSAPIKAPGVYPTNNGPITVNLNGGVIQACYSTAELKSFFDDLGGLAGVSVGGTVRNSYFAGTANGGGIGGLVGASQNESRKSTITDSYFAGVDKPVSAGNAYNENDPSVGKKTVDFMKTAAFAELLNANLPDTGYHWKAASGSLPVLVQGRPEGVPDASTEALAAAIREAKELVETKYTPETWTALKEALAQAEKTMKDSAAKQEDVDAAETALRAAIAGLREKPVEIRTEAVALPDTGVIEITAQDQIKTMTAENTKGKYYRLANDIVIDDGYWYGTSFAGVLDGGGHTITIANQNPLFEHLTAEAVIQNTGFLGEVKGSGVDIGGVAVDSNGLIVNCWNRMIVSTEGNNSVRKDSGAFVAHLKKGGAIVNSYVAGKVFSKGDKGAGVPGAFAATSEVNTLVRNGMYLNTTANNPVGNAAGAVENCTRQKRGGFYSQENLAALNANRGACGREWTIDNDGWFHLGAAGSFDPSVGAGMRFTFDPVYKREPVDFSSGDGIEFSMGDFLIPAETEGEMPGILGTFSNPNFDGQIALVPEYTAVGQGSHGVMTYDDGGLVVSYPGDLTVHVMDKASWSGTGYEKELTSFTIVVTPITAEELRLIPRGKYVDPVKNTIQGSGNVVTEAQVKVNGQWMKGNPTSFGFSIEGKVFGEGDGFRPTAPGKIKIGCYGFGKSATLEMESLYVPVTLIRPYPYGVHWIHERDANSNKLGNFLDLNLADQAGRVYIEPENASYNGDGSWKMDSSDPKIAEYISDFLLAVLPYKAGKVTLTATSLDPNLKEPVTGTSEIELKYTNPVTAVQVNLNELDEAHLDAETGHMILTGSEEIKLPIHFTGTRGPELHEDPNDGIVKEFSWHVSEPEMIWYQEGDGEVEISVDGNIGMWVKTPIENCVANDSFKITGVVNGTVTVTGIPADKTNKVEPVTFTVEVSGVTDPEPYDVKGFINRARPSAIAGVKSGIKYMCGSDEWQVLSLIRTGEQLPQDKLDAYYNSAVETLTKWPASRKPTEFERVALALSAMGKDITSVGGINLAERIYNHKYLSDGSNEVAFALIALDARNTAIPDDARNTRASMVELLLSFQNEDGGFGLAPGSSSGADTTSMSLQALAPYQDQPLVAAAIENGLVYLKNNVHTKAGHFDQGTVEANAQTIIAMAVLGRDLLDEPGFSSARYNLMKAMEPYHVGGEGFKHTAVDPRINAMATAQALQGMDAYDRFLNGKTGYWDFTDQAVYPEINPDGHAVADVLDQIHRLPDAADVAERDRKAIESARNAYDALTPDQKALVNADRLIAAEEALANPGKPDPDSEAAKAVMDLIGKLPAEITLADKAQIEAAQAAYDKLTDAQKKLVTNLNQLIAAQEALAKLEGGKPDPEPEAGNRIYFSVERFVIGQGFVVEPVVVEFNEGEHYFDIIKRVLGDRASVRDNNNYLEMIKGANLGPDQVNIPDYIVELSKNRKGVPSCTTEIVRNYYAERGFTAWPAEEGQPLNLGEFTYSPQAGWKYSVNGLYPSLGINQQPVAAGDIVRLQYTVFGLGIDLEGKDNIRFSNMDQLVKAMALVNNEAPALKENAALKAAYSKAAEMMQNPTQDQKTVDATAKELLKALEDAKNQTNPAELVKEMIRNLPETSKLTENDRKAVEEARKAYNALTADEKKLVDNADKLIAAEKALEDIAAAQKAEDLIAALPENITLDNKAQVEEARTAFNALTPEQRRRVSNEKKLKDAEAAIETLESMPEKVPELFDPASGVTLKGDELTSDMELLVGLLGADDEAVEIMRSKIPSSEGLVRIYDVRLISAADKDTPVEIELTGTATLKLPVSRQYENQRLKVLFVDDAGHAKKTTAKVTNGTISLNITKLGLGAFGIVVRAPKPTPQPKPAPDKNNNGNKPVNGGTVIRVPSSSASSESASSAASSESAAESSSAQTESREEASSAASESAGMTESNTQVQVTGSGSSWLMWIVILAVLLNLILLAVICILLSRMRRK